MIEPSELLEAEADPRLDTVIGLLRVAIEPSELLEAEADPRLDTVIGLLRVAIVLLCGIALGISALLFLSVF